MSVVTVSAPRHYVDRGWPAIAATIEIEGHCYEVYYRASQGPLTTRADPFLAAALLPAMSIGAPLRVDGLVSASLVPHIARVQDILSAWYKPLRKVAVQVAVQGGGAEAALAGRGAGCFFSGGVDSFYSALKNSDEITDLIFVHGWDIAVNDHPMREKATTALRTAAADMGKNLLEVETNARNLFDAYTEWNKESHGAGLGSAALTLPLRLSKVFVAATCAYDEMIPHGSHPLLDPLWGTDQIEIVHDGCESDRWQKLAAVMHNPVVRRTLRSCWEHPHGEYNCCSCYGCLLNMTFLRLHDVLDKFSVYDQPLDLDKLARLPVSRIATHRLEDALLEMAARKGTDPELEQALRTALSAGWVEVGRDTANEAQAQIGILREQVTEALGRVWVLEQQRTRLQQEMEQQKSRLQQEMEQQKAGWQQEIAQSTEQARQWEAQSRSYELRARHCEEQTRAEQARVAQLEAQRYRLTSSTSWRLTAPLRTASEAWRGLRKGQKR